MLAPEPLSCRRSAAAQEVDDQNHQCYDEQQVDETTADVQTETQKPQN
jgi:hypothetical protein